METRNMRTLNRRGLIGGALTAPFVLRGALGQTVSSPGLTPSGVRTIARSGSTLRTWVPDNLFWGPPGAFIFTLATQWSLEADYSLIRLVFSNPTAASYAIPMVKVSPSSALGDGHSPVNAAGANDFTMFVQVFFNNAGLDVQPQDQTTWGSGTSTFTVPANGGSLLQPTRWFSDWTRVQSLARTDAGTLPLLMVRTLTDANATFQAATVNPVNWLANVNRNGRSIDTWTKQAVDSVTTPALISAPGHNANTACNGVQYIGSTPGFTVLGVGDSITQGGGSSTQYHGWAYLSSMAVSSPPRPVSYFQQGVSGSVSSDYWANGYTAFKISKPDVVTISTWTPNETMDQAHADIEWSRAIDLASYVLKNGSIPVLMGPLPWGGISTGAQELARLSARTRMLNAAQYGMQVLDWEAVMGTGASPNLIQPGLVNTTTAVYHPNDAGNALMASAVFTPALANILRA
jgi:hypothetical protein